MAGNAEDREDATGALFYHGGNLAAARIAFPDAERPWIDLSTGINPLPYPVAELPAEAWTRLPEAADVAALRDAAAGAYGVASPASLVAAPGTQALLQWLPRLLPAQRVGILGFTYAEHGRCWARAGAEVRVVPELDALAAFDVAVVVNPNNPDGRLVPRDALASLARGLARRGGTLVVDEAFMDVLPPQASLAATAADLGNVVVLRSFGKTYGLAGARLGFAVAEPGLAARLADLLGPWAVAGPALALGRRALSDRAWLAATTRRLVEDQQRLAGLLRAAGLPPAGGTPLFTLVAHPDAHGLFRRLAARGILSRAFAGAPTWLRLGLPAPADWPLLQDRLARL